MSVVNCSRCGRAGMDGKDCEGCGLYLSKFGSVKPATLGKSRGTSATAQVGDELTLLSAIAANTAKTKHAVRAIALFLMIEVTSGSAAWLFYYWGTANSNPTECASWGTHCPSLFPLIIALIIAVAGFFTSVFVAWGEIAKSE